MKTVLFSFSDYMTSSSNSIYELSGTNSNDYLENTISGLFSASDLITLVTIVIVYAVFIVVLKVTIESRKLAGNVRQREDAHNTLSNVIYYGISGLILTIIVIGYLLTL